MSARAQKSCGATIVVDLASLIYSRINRGQMLVTFADSHSALSVLDVDGMKVSHAWSPVEWVLPNPPDIPGFCVAVHPSPHPCLRCRRHERAGARTLHSSI